MFEQLLYARPATRRDGVLMNGDCLDKRIHPCGVCMLLLKDSMEGKDSSTPDCWQEAGHIQDPVLSGHKLSCQQLKVGFL